jgi:hypothetical protein
MPRKKKTSLETLEETTVEIAKLADLKDAAKNPRTHTDEQIGEIAASIQEWGFTNPILIDEKKTIIAGHGRKMAAERLGLASVPVIVATGWSEEQKRAYLIADNKIALNAGWDVDVLRREIEDLAQLDFDIPLIGFDPEELMALQPPPEPGGGGDDGPAEPGGSGPDGPLEDESEYRTLIIHTKAPEDFEALLEALDREVSADTRYIWFPDVTMETPEDRQHAERYLPDA